MCAALPANNTAPVDHSSPAEMGVQPAREHRGAVRAPARSLGGGEDGPISPHFGAGKSTDQQSLCLRPHKKKSPDGPVTYKKRRLIGSLPK